LSVFSISQFSALNSQLSAFFSLSAFQMTIAILGSGALGLFYGTRLAQAGHDLRFLLRSDLAIVRARGSVIANFVETGERLEIHPVSSFATTAEIGRVDLVVVTSKPTANLTLHDLLPPLLGPGTAVLTLQNGIGSDEDIAAIAGPQRVLSAL